MNFLIFTHFTKIGSYFDGAQSCRNNIGGTHFLHDVTPTNIFLFTLYFIFLSEDTDMDYFDRISAISILNMFRCPCRLYV